MEQQRITKKFKPLRGCRNFACSGCIFFLIILVILVIIAYFRLDSLWPEVATRMNNYIEIPDYELTTISTVRQSLNSQVTQIGLNNIEISQNHLTTIINERIRTESITYILIEEKSLNILIPIEFKDLKPALYLQIELEVKNNDLEIKNTKLGNIYIPGFVIDFLLENFMTSNGFDKNEGLKQFVIKTFLPEIKDAVIEQIQFENEKMIMQINFTPNII